MALRQRYDASPSRVVRVLTSKTLTSNRRVEPTKKRPTTTTTSTTRRRIIVAGVVALVSLANLASIALAHPPPPSSPPPPRSRPPSPPSLHDPMPLSQSASSPPPPPTSRELEALATIEEAAAVGDNFRRFFERLDTAACNTTLSSPFVCALLNLSLTRLEEREPRTLYLARLVALHTYLARPGEAGGQTEDARLKPFFCCS